MTHATRQRLAQLDYSTRDAAIVFVRFAYRCVTEIPLQADSDTARDLLDSESQNRIELVRRFLAGEDVARQLSEAVEAIIQNAPRDENFLWHAHGQLIDSANYAAKSIDPDQLKEAAGAAIQVASLLSQYATHQGREQFVSDFQERLVREMWPELFGDPV